jgi:hypothetical protein
VRRATGVTNGHIEQSSKDGVLIRWDDLARPLFIHS